MHNKLMLDFKVSLDPYLFFWEEWALDSNCNLNDREIAMVNNYLRGDFEIGFLEAFFVTGKGRQLKEVTRKLELGYQIFKDFVIVRFLFLMISIAKQYGYNDFLSSPVSQLKVSPKLKDLLLSFKAYTVQQLFIIYRVEDFGRKPVYKKIVAFHTYMKQAVPAGRWA